MELGFYGTFELDQQHDITEERIGAGAKLPLLLQLLLLPLLAWLRGGSTVRAFNSKGETIDKPLRV